jgi:hypothetical protein
MEKQEKKGLSLKVAMAVVQGWAATIYPFMRIGIGKNHPGILGLFGMGWLVLWVAYARCNGLLWLIPLYLLGQLFHLLGHARKPKKVHTNYAGQPFLAMKFLRFKDEAAAKRFGEPLICFLFGMALIGCGYDEGKYFAFGTAALIANQALIELFDRRRIDDMRDGTIESEFLMGQLHNRRRV